MATNIPSDQVIQSTNDDATSSKAYAVKRGYWVDPYIKYFSHSPSRPTPEINRGYFVRAQAFKALTISFIKNNEGKCQVLNLGAGSDTLYFNLRDANILPLKFVEVDLEHNVLRKSMIIKNKKLLRDVKERTDVKQQPESHATKQGDSAADAGTQNPPRTYLATDDYCLVSFDLRRPVEQLVGYLCDADMTSGRGLNSTLPTLFLAECVLVYMSPSQSLQLLQGISSKFPNAAFLHYEQVNMHDRFGSVMVSNFHARGCDLPGIPACGSIQEQEKRFLDAGWKNAKAWTVTEVYQALGADTRSR
ncbi:unnamed protein product [Calicophoron daubneyi]